MISQWWFWVDLNLQDDIKDDGDIVEFVRKREVPLVGQYKANNIKLYQKYRPLCFVFYTVDWSFDHKDGKVVGGGDGAGGHGWGMLLVFNIKDCGSYLVDNVL